MKTSKTEITAPLQIVLVGPPSGIDFGIQEGKGNDYKTILVQRSKAEDLQFEFRIAVKGVRDDGPPNFVGPLAQGPATGRFLYIDVGTYAGQKESCWQRRMKVPLQGITWEQIDVVLGKPKRVLQATIPGTGKDGGPSCATVKPIDGWKVVKST
jgi:hypothetical protein